MFLYAFDLIELDGADLRSEPIERRKAALATLLRRTKPGLKLSEHLIEAEVMSCSSTPASSDAKASVASAWARATIRPLCRLGQGQEPASACGAARGGGGLVARPMKDHQHTIDRWDDSGDNLIEEIAAVSDFMVALATYKAAIERWPKDKITLRNRARVIEKNWV